MFLREFEMYEIAHEVLRWDFELCFLARQWLWCFKKAAGSRNDISG